MALIGGVCTKSSFGHEVTHAPKIAHLLHKTSRDGLLLNYESAFEPVLLLFIDSGLEVDDVSVNLQYLGNLSSNHDTMAAIHIINQTNFPRTVSFTPTSVDHIDELANGTALNVTVDAYPGGPVDHHKTTLILLGKVLTKHWVTFQTQQNPGALTSLSLAPLAAGSSLITDGIGPDLAIRGISIDPAPAIPSVNGVILNMTVNATDIIIGLDPAP